jgi:hypothetical protein
MGNLIMIQDYDARCPFSIEMLIDKFKEEYNIDLTFQKDPNEIKSKYFSNNKEELYISYDPYGIDGIKDVIVSSNNGKPVYEVHILLSEDYPRRIIRIEGTTGTLISDEGKMYPNIK